MIDLRMKDGRLLQRIQKECEAVAKDTPPPANEAKRGFKFDYCENTVIVEKKKKKGQLEPYQMALVNDLLMKKWDEVKRDVIFEDDIHNMKIFVKILGELRQEETTDKKVIVEANKKKYIKL